MKRTTITATDRIGRSESITLLLDDSIAEHLQKAAQECYFDGSPCSRLEYELNAMYEDVKYGCSNALSRSQFVRLRAFYGLIYDKFYKYKLTIHIS